MSDDSFIREVNEELRQDQAKALWERFGALIVGVAVAIVLGTAAFVGYEYWAESRANRSGDAFGQALNLANSGQSAEALEALRELQEEGHGAYPLLARMRAATVLAETGDYEGAIEAFDTVAADGSIPDSLRDIARLRAAFLLVDHGSYADVSARVENLTADSNALRHSAREALALSAWKEGNAGDALTLFTQISADAAAPASARQRAELMSELIRGSGAAAAS